MNIADLAGMMLIGFVLFAMEDGKRLHRVTAKQQGFISLRFIHLGQGLMRLLVSLSRLREILCDSERGSIRLWVKLGKSRARCLMSMT